MAEDPGRTVQGAIVAAYRELRPLPAELRASAAIGVTMAAAIDLMTDAMLAGALAETRARLRYSIAELDRQIASWTTDDVGTVIKLQAADAGDVEARAADFMARLRDRREELPMSNPGPSGESR